MSFVVGDPADDDAIRFDIVLITVFWQSFILFYL